MLIWLNALWVNLSKVLLDSSVLQKELADIAAGLYPSLAVTIQPPPSTSYMLEMIHIAKLHADVITRSMVIIEYWTGMEDGIVAFEYLCRKEHQETKVMDILDNVLEDMEFRFLDYAFRIDDSCSIQEVVYFLLELCLVKAVSLVSTCMGKGKRTYTVFCHIINFRIPQCSQHLSCCLPGIPYVISHKPMDNKWHHLNQLLELLSNQEAIILYKITCIDGRDV